MFTACGMPILAGRDVDDRDTLRSPKVRSSIRRSRSTFFRSGVVGQVMRVTFAPSVEIFPSAT
jgi:hypothetical protein